MGYAEFGGGGSVKWFVKHTERGTTSKDTDTILTNGGYFTIEIVGYQPITVPIDQNNPEQVRLLWNR